MYFKFTQF